MEGRDVLLALRRQEETSELPIIVLSADASQANRATHGIRGDGLSDEALDLGELWRTIAQVFEKSLGRVA